MQLPTLFRRESAFPSLFRHERPLFEEMRSMMDRSFSELMHDVFSGEELATTRRQVVTPRIDLSESDKDYRVVAELPGVERKDLDIELIGDRLTIRATRKKEKEEKGRDYHRFERTYGSFLRTLTLPDEVEADKIEAHLEDGILTVTLPKVDGAKRHARHIEVH